MPIFRYFRRLEFAVILNLGKLETIQTLEIKR